MTSKALVRVLVTALATAGCETSSTSPPNPAPFDAGRAPPVRERGAYVQPRLVGITRDYGTYQVTDTISYAPDGYPVSFVQRSVATEGELTWANGELETATLTTDAGGGRVVTSAVFTYAETGVPPARRVVRMKVADAETVVLEYRENGSLASSRHSFDGYTMFAYDSDNRLVRTTFPKGKKADTVAYGSHGCPTYAGGQTTFTYVFLDRLNAFNGVPISYDERGRIAARGVDAGMPRFTYEPGEAKGISIVPDWEVGGFGRPELLHMDGTCDGSLSSQPAILGQLVRSLRRYAPD